MGQKRKVSAPPKSRFVGDIPIIYRHYNLNSRQNAFPIT